MSTGFSRTTRWAFRQASLWLAGCVAACAQPVISEFLAGNTTSPDDDGAFSDWIELHNPTGETVDLTGWSLTDAASNKTKWQFPAVTLEPGSYLLVYASNKDRRDAAAALHTNFALGKEGEYLGLIRADGSVAHEFAPAFPAQTDDVSYGIGVLDDGTTRIGFFNTPTPGAPNGPLRSAPVAQSVAFSRPPGLFTDAAISVQLTGAGVDQQIRFTLVQGPGSPFDEPTAASPAYDGPIVLTHTATIRAAIFSADGATRGPVTTAHYLKLDASLASFSSRLPVLVLDDLGAGPLEKDNIDHPSWLLGFKSAAPTFATFASAPDFVTPLTASVRGNSSADFPKKSYNVRLRDERFQRRSAPLLDLPAYERWALIAPWSFDPNFINNVFVYDLSNRLGRWAPRTRLAEVFFNADGSALDASDYAGIYVITDRIRLERGRVELAELSSSDNTAPAITGGYIFKIDAPDPDEIGWKTARNVPEADETQVVLVAPAADDITPAQLGYLQDNIQRMEDALHADRAASFAQRTYLDYLDRSSWVDHHLLNVLVNNPDALHRSAYFHKNRGNRIAAGPVWDFDRALGTFWDDRESVVESWSGVGGSSVNVWRTGWWGILAEDPEFIQEWIDRWQSLRTGQLSTPALTTLFQSHANLVGPDAAARDVDRWPDSVSIVGTYADQIAYVKDWLARRTEWIDSQFVARPVVATTAGSATFTAPPGAILAYTLDGSDPRALGGELAPNALTSDEPLTVASSANVHVRAYDRSRVGAPPTSPWSSAVGTSSANPLTPFPRFANVSLRGHLGSDENPLAASVGVADTEAKSYLVRAIGPGLAAFGTEHPAAEPQLRITDTAGNELQRNAGWQTHPEPDRLADIARTVGAFPLVADSRDSALVHTTPAGAFTAQIASPGNPGPVLLELFPADTYGRTTGIVAQGVVRAGEPLVAGFVIQGSAYKRILIRGLGPGLATRGIAAPLGALELTLTAGPRQIATNENWSDNSAAATIEAVVQRLALSPLSPDHADAALFVTLAPGAYTVEVKAKPDTAGAARLELHAVP